MPDSRAALPTVPDLLPDVLPDALPDPRSGALSVPVSPDVQPTRTVALAAGSVAPAEDDLADLMVAFRSFQMHHARVLARESAARGLNATDTRFVLFLAATGTGVTPKQAGEHLELSTGAMTSLIDRLERHGHIRRGPNPDDRRSLLLRLTPSGAAVAQQISGVYSAAAREVVAPADRARLATQFTLLGEALARHSRAASL
ncbi:MarR family winged helix-turn-helix transcriptional regulator [Curtobacterium sp. MCPF17_047]|uniref:MarR family winged helix-turn-helix transcriptional regulator n=1 Tax=Curtobacterium sp. MCPF17_047 TaxID=2175654 RepID=UPI0015E8DA22|nr:MarR family transcriptional regulator [Curtobacterium sp. MCPF17_047]